MFRRLFIRAALSIGFLLVLLAPAASFAATDPFGNLNCNGQQTNSAVCQTRGNTEDPLTGPNGTIVRATNVIALVAGFMAVIFLILGGIKYITAGGAPDQISKAKDSIIFALVGIVVIVISRALIGFVLGRI